MRRQQQKSMELLHYLPYTGTGHAVQAPIQLLRLLLLTYFCLFRLPIAANIKSKTTGLHSIHIYSIRHRKADPAVRCGLGNISARVANPNCQSVF
jgi:hypothetical protein